jgi:hypothetical protein
MTEYERAAEEFRGYHGGGFQGGHADEATIAGAEARLGVGLPASYRSFLREFGWGGIPPLDVFGLGENVRPHLDLVRQNEELRASGRPKLPKHLVAVAEDGGGNPLCLDTQQMQGEECPVVFWSNEESGHQVPMEMAKNFGEWLWEKVEATRPFRESLG